MKFTYQTDNTNQKLETYEWDNVWIEHANGSDAKRVLYIGDSISCGTRMVATKQAGEKILFDGFGTSKALDNSWLKPSVGLFAQQQGRREAVIFNNGLHGWHIEDETEYKALYEEMILFLLEEFKETPLLLVLTTHITDAERDARVVLRNKAALELAEKYGLGVIDLYEVTKDEALIGPDGVHLTAEGYELLAKTILEKVKEIV